MSISVSLAGGPPWGFRLSNNADLQPVVAKVLPGGRACVEGIRIGDVLEEVNHQKVTSASQAHNLIQEAKGRLDLQLARTLNGFHETVTREKLSSSCQNTPLSERKTLTALSVPSSPIQPRQQGFLKQVHLDVQGVKGSAENKRRIFEQLCSPSSTDSLLQRKIQLGGCFAGVPSEKSTTGYGSVGGDFAGGNSGRTSPLSSLMSAEEEEDKTVYEAGLESRILAEKLRNNENKMLLGEEMGLASPGSSQWTVKAESHSVAPAEGAIEVPGRRSVASLRQAITDKLEMKSPNGTPSGRRTPSWNNVKVFEGVDDEPPNKPVFGKVLEGPVAPTKYYQGVPPPSYYINTAPTHFKPPPPPSVPPKPPKPSLSNDFEKRGEEGSQRNSFLNSVAARTEEAPSPVPSQNSLDVSSHSNLYYNNYYGPSSPQEDPMISSLLSTSITTTTSEQAAETAPEDPSSAVETPETPRRGSMDLESSQLLKSKSPSPYRSATADHYATISRRVPTPVKLQIDEPTNKKTFSYSTTTNDSGYGETTSPKEQFDTFSTNSTVPLSSVGTIETLSLDSAQPERPESLLSFSTLDGEAFQEKEDITLLRPASNETEMSNAWYKNMFKKMHRLDPSAEPILRQQLRESSPSVSSTISRPLTPTSCVFRPPSRFECEIKPRSRSVGRVIEPADKAAWERSKTTHYHLPSYSFKDEDARAFPCSCSSRSCLRCGRPRKTPSWSEIDYLYRSLGEKEIHNESHAQKLQSRVSRRAISDRLDQATRELEVFLTKLDILKSNEKEDSPSPSQVAEEIAELKRISKEELMLRQKAEKLGLELEDQRQRRHGYIPTTAPALQKNFDRFEGLLNDYAKESSPAASSNRSRSPAPVVKTATVVYKFVPKSPRELALNKGDVVRISRQIDNNWLEGERNGRCGIFPVTYVQINNETDSRQKMRAVYPFTARNSNEMSLKIGEFITWRRDIDQNWSEGANHIGEIGIFPKCYVRPVDEEMDTPGSVIPARPKTPKITFEADCEEEKTVTFDPQTPHSTPQIAQKDSEEPLQEAFQFSQQEPFKREIPISFQREEASKPAQRHPAFSEDTPVGYTNGYKENSYSNNLRDTHPQGSDLHRKPPTADYSSAPAQLRGAWNGVNLANLIPKGSEIYRAVFSYTPQKEDELELEVDDIVFVVEKCDDGWFIGTNLSSKVFGTFPGNYVMRH